MEPGLFTRPLVRLREGVPYCPGPKDFVIREEHSIDDVLRHLISECGGDKTELLAILETIPCQTMEPDHDPLLFTEALLLVLATSAPLLLLSFFALHQ